MKVDDKTQRIFPLFLILISASLGILAFPKVSWSFLAWVAFGPFFMALEKKSSRERFVLGVLFGLIYSFGLFYWVTHSMIHYGGLGILTSYSLLLLLVLYLSLYTGVFSWLWGLIPSQGLFPLLWVPSIWVGLEYIRAHLFTGFPWEIMGHSQYNNLLVIQVAELVGDYGVSFLILLVNQSLYQLFLTGTPFKGWSRKWKESLLTLILLALTFLFGIRALENQISQDEKAPTIKVALVQGNIDQSIKWNPDFQGKTIEIYKQLSATFRQEAPDLVIWPETAVPFYFKEDTRFSPQLYALARETGSYLLFGSPAAETRKGIMHFFNRAYLLSPEGTASFYDKLHLVPFGEYVPMKRFFPFVGKMVEAIGDFSPGPGSHGLNHPKGKLGVLICFETIFSELSRAYKKDGCQFLVNMTNDAWFGQTSAPYQHLSMLTFRAIENRLWIARAANTGFSAVIDSSGQIIKRFPLFQSGGLYAKIPLRSEQTFYSRYGDLLIVFCCLVFLGGLAKADNRSKRGKRS
jgi:apolipoprotein N-acyltransferase